ncbi:MAG: hypothetical protein ACREBY_05405 [Polaromonas sp.]
MSFFNWFSGKPHQAKSAANDEPKRAVVGRDKPAAAHQPQRPAPEAANRGGDRKVQRHARREQLYVAIREAMTRAGVLSASYKFKVLSLDQRGNEFLVMMDLAKAFGGPPEQLTEIEALIVQNAKARFEITVPAVYWRLDEVAAVSKPPRPSAQEALQMAAPPAKPAKPTDARYEPIQADEVAAFKQALLAASARGPAAVAENGVKTRSGPRSYTLLTGFEDTELPESAASPALSSTQYGDLN